MVKCRVHPEEDAVAVCQKFGYGYCKKCCEAGEKGPGCTCTSPRVHCKFRQECVVHYLSRKRDKARS